MLEYEPAFESSSSMLCTHLDCRISQIQGLFDRLLRLVAASLVYSAQFLEIYISNRRFDFFFGCMIVSALRTLLLYSSLIVQAGCLPFRIFVNFSWCLLREIVMKAISRQKLTCNTQMNNEVRGAQFFFPRTSQSKSGQWTNQLLGNRLHPQFQNDSFPTLLL